MLIAAEGVRNRRWLIVACLGLLPLAFPKAVSAQYILDDEKDPHRYDPGLIVVPIGYHSGSFSSALGMAESTSGYFQPQVSSFAFLVGSTNGSYAAIGGMSDIQVRPFDRLFFDWQLSDIRTDRDENNVDGDRHFPNETAGTNFSSGKNFIGKASNDYIGDFTFKYVLPIGDGRDNVIHHYQLHDGLLSAQPAGGDAFNPLTSGRTYLEVAPFFEYLDLRSRFARQKQWDTDGLNLSVVYDNRDYVLTPEKGSITTFTVSRDFGIIGSSNPWTNLSAEQTQYVSLGKNNLFRQTVLAFDGWTDYCPTWSQTGSPGHVTVRNGTPFFAGAELGGMNRMRGFPEDRYHSRAGVFGSVELRLIPQWNPLGKWDLLKPADIAWMQFVVFAEGGRVADEYTFDKLFSHMKGDGGVGIRILTSDTVLRIDVAGSSEGIQVWANMDQAF